MGLANTAIKIGSKIGTGASKVANVFDDVVVNPGLKNLEEAVAEQGAKAGREIAEEATEEVTEKAIKKVSSGIGKNAFIGGAVGSVTGAGIGGIAGLATGADEDDTKSMIFMGALAGATGGSIIGGSSKMLRNKAVSGEFFSQIDKSVAETAEEIATGEANHAVKNGANGLFNKIDDLGSNIAKKASKGERFELAKQLKKAANGEITSKEALDLANEASTKSVKELRRGFFTEIEGPDGYIKKINEAKLTKEDAEHFTKIIRNANTIGGASQGAIIGSLTGATIGGISGGIDEDETFIGGALKGGFIGGTIGGIGGGASGFLNNDARILSNTTTNVKSLFGK